MFFSQQIVSIKEFRRIVIAKHLLIGNYKIRRYFFETFKLHIRVYRQLDGINN